ncbi:hypothetical protein A2U01_0097519, partial [Trifolium medium]|nr:hypothetical protein [Trifolium medium]
MLNGDTVKRSPPFLT